MNIFSLIALIEKEYPLKTACSWDSTGWQIKFENEEISNIILALDITENVIETAIKYKTNLIITHHPFIFQQTIKELKTNKWKNQLYKKILKNKINIYSIHTNFDKSKNGLNFLIAKDLEIKNLKYINKEKIAVVGDYNNDLKYIIAKVKEYFQYSQVKLVSKDISSNIKKIVISCGAGGDTIHDLKDNHINDTLFITGEMKWHEEIEGYDKNINLLIIGHNMEEKFINFLSDFLFTKKTNLQENQIIKVFPKKSFFI